MKLLSVKFVALVAVLSGSMLTSPLFAQNRSAESNAVLEVLPSSDADNLGRYLSRLASNPRDVDALIGAGEVALKLDDPLAATGFFARAEDVSPQNGRVKAGLARAMLALENPVEAVRLFGQAARYGVKDADIAADRGLAFDLVGETDRAQHDYKQALERSPNDPKILRRYAVSLGISGKWQEAERVLDPLLRKSDKSAWRDRAFILAMNGQAKQARNITQVMMPKSLATAIQPFMDRMPMLTAAQRAAAVHFGNFPSTAAQASVPSAGDSKPDTALVPSGQPLGRTATAPSASASNKKGARSKKDKQPLPTEPARTAMVQSVPAADAAVPTSPPATSANRGSHSRNDDMIGPPSSPATGRLEAKAPQPGSASTPTRPIPPVPAPAPPRQVQTDGRSLADIMSGVTIPAAERTRTVAPVDLAEIARIQAEKRKAAEAAEARIKARAKADAEARAKAEAKAKAKAEADAKAKNPARTWVQIATGRDLKALAFDMGKMRKKYGAVLKGKDAWTSAWGSTRRMVIGPFASESAAKNFYSDWLKAGGDGYIWHSTDGLQVEKLDE